jgi:hypothetical protein
MTGRKLWKYLGCLVLMVGVGAMPLMAQTQNVLLASNRVSSESFYSLAEYGDAIPALQNEVSLNLQGATVQTALEAIAYKAGLGLSYNSELVASSKKEVSLELVYDSVADALQTVLAGTMLDAVISQRGEIVIVEGPGHSGNSAPVRLGTISGQVINTKTGEPLEGASVSLEGTGKWVSTDEEGHYHIEGVEPGTYTLVADYMGYRTESNAVSAVSIYRGPSLDFALKPVEEGRNRSQAESDPAFVDIEANEETAAESAVSLLAPQVLPGSGIEDVSPDNLRLETGVWNSQFQVQRQHVNIDQTNQLERLLDSVRSPSLLLLQTGRITGRVTDAETGDPLPGVNVVIEGEQQGATTDADGYYTILNVAPGNYTLRASFVGYTAQSVANVEVNIDLTTNVDFELQEQTVGMDEVTVQASEPIVKRDISANVSNLSSEDMQNMPVMSVSDVIGLQAGIQGLNVRGGGLDELQFNVDGASTFDPRSHSPYTGVSYTSIQEIQIQTGGFNAEYGNARSGLINVVTKDGSPNYYSADVIMRYSPPSDKSFAPSVDDLEGFWVRPYQDPEVAFEGTESSVWDRYTRRQYPQFEGWNSVAERLSDEYDLTAEQWQQVWEYRHRKDVTVRDPDYTIDGSFGGPVPGISDMLGNLRFFASFRQTRSAYLIPQNRDSYDTRMGRLKVTSDIAPGMKLKVEGLLNKDTGINDNLFGNSYGMFTGNGRMISNMRDNISFGHQIFADDAWSYSDVIRNMGGVTLTHSLGANTYYEARLSRMHTDYLSYKGRMRSDDIVETIGDFELTEEPMGFSWSQSLTECNCMRLGGMYSANEDSSWATRWDGEFNLTSQLNRYIQLKSGLDYILTENRRLIRGTSTASSRQGQDWHRSTAQGAAYTQAKLDFEALVANVGVRMDYFDALGEWYDYDRYDESFSVVAEQATEIEDVLDTEPIDARWYLSPRLGVSFPITTDSKFFFNYGHFRGRLEPNNIFRIDRVNAINSIGNPNHPMPRTISYELGYEQNLFDRLLVRVTGYYKDISDQPRYVSFVSTDGEVNYSTSLPYDYEDIRGFEATLRKHAGWVRGFANFTFMARKSGDFGWGTYNENPVEQEQYELSQRNYQFAPVPRPYARINLEFIAPQEFGPAVGGLHPLEDWRLSWLGSWSAGYVETWCGQSGGCPLDLQDNIRWRGSRNVDLRLARNFQVGASDLQFFVDVSNVFNIRELNTSAFTGYGSDRTHYMRSLQFEDDIFEDIDSEPHRYIPGDDRPGDYREPGVEFRPIEITNRLDGVSDPVGRALYYVPGDNGDMASGTYHQFANGQWQEADRAEVEEILDTNAYIDMPNWKAWTFLHPRRFQFGLRITI